MAGTSSSQSTSQSSTQVLDYPERAFLDSIAQYAGTVGQNVYNWAQDAYAKNSSLTDANISNYLKTSQASFNQAGALQDRYNNKINPEIDNQLREANNYASATRQALDMGAAESGQMQGTEAALANHKRDLQSYGIDPSAGRYAGLDEAAKVSGAASAVGAAQQAQRADVTMGQNLRQQGINNASSAATAENAGLANDYNTALQGFAGAENAGLANANTGVALMGAANPYLSNALSYKPITGTNSSSQSTSNSVTSDPPQSSKDQSSNSGNGSGGGSYDPSGITNYGGGVSGGSSGGQNQTDNPYYQGDNGGSGDIWGTGSGTDMSGYGGDAGGGFGYDPSGSNGTYGSGYDPGSSDSLGGYNSGDFSGGYQDYSGGFDASSDYSGDGSGMAEGGVIPDDDTSDIQDDGGAIPDSASPSGGAVTDDVHAQLPSGKPINVNAGEFVVPQDVLRFKGEEFFQNLIMKSRKARAMAPAKPSQGMRQANG